MRFRRPDGALDWTGTVVPAVDGGEVVLADVPRNYLGAQARACVHDHRDPHFQVLDVEVDLPAHDF